MVDKQCPRCGETLPAPPASPRPGRPPTWCSQRCRRAAYEERRAAANGAIAVRTEIIEKPSDPPSSYSVTGIYFYDPEVFDIIRGLHPSRRGEYEVTDVSNAYIERGSLTFGVLKSWWGDAGTFDGWTEANELAKELIYEELEARPQ